MGAYDKDLLERAFKAADTEGGQADGLLSLDEFIECMKHKAIANIFCIPTQMRQKVPHHPCLSDRPWFKEANAKSLLPTQAKTRRVHCGGNKRAQLQATC